MTQPRLSQDTRRLLNELGLGASLYQPTSLFVKNGRKLPNSPEPGDPWQCFLRRDGAFGVISEGVGANPDEAVIVALRLRPGLKHSLERLGVAVDLLTEAIHARQD